MGRNVFNVIIDRVVSAVRVKLTDPTETNTAAVDASGNVSVKLAAGANTAGSVKVTDGTNYLPTGDVASRRVFVQPTDGTNLMPTGDAAARRILTGITDATNAVSVMKDDGVTLVSTGFNVGGIYAGAYNKSLNLDVSSADGRAATGSFNICQMVQARSWGFNGTTFDRLRSVNTGQLVTTIKDSGGTERFNTRTNPGIVMDAPGSPAAGQHDHGSVVADYALDVSAGIAQSASFDLFITSLTLYDATDALADANVAVALHNGTSYIWAGNTSLWGTAHFTFPKPLKIPAGATWYTAIQLGGSVAQTMYVYYAGYQISTAI